MDAQYNPTNITLFSNKCCICFFEMGMLQGLEMFQDSASVVSVTIQSNKIYFCRKTLLPLIYKALVRSKRK